MFKRVSRVILFASSAAAFGQGPFESLPRPPIPADPLELVTAAAQQVQTPEQRLAATMLLTHARDLSNVRAQPYDLKTSFLTSGSLPSDGSWTMEDIAIRGAYRWTAQGPNYSGVTVYPGSTQGLAYSNQAGGSIPLRLKQVREAIFFVNPPMGPRAAIRVAAGYLNGAAQSCVLNVTGAGGRTFTGARNWEEEEYCVDSNTGLLTTYSPAPGLYVRYDYSTAKQFHGKTIPNGFTITEAGRQIVDARIENVTDPAASAALFNTNGLTAAGVGRVMDGGSRFRGFVPLGKLPVPGATGNSRIQVAVLHGNAMPDGSISELEILASSDASLNQTALNRAAAQQQMRLGARSQPGATPQSEHIFFTFEFLVSQ
ncbi:MAG: hypothetical protein JO307_18535 [Bryobacterales bacterium]|nr:hypothetical protein [Bryobacterales bacterium]MBV9398184.1 hypothetical protein [Bryobacterales bacterium]